MVSEFDQLAAEFANTKTQECKIRLFASAMAMPDIRKIIKSQSHGWNGESGKFARVISCMLSHLY